MPMTTLTPTDEFSEPVQVEANGTVITKEGIGDLGLQRLANQATFLKNRVPGTDVAVPVMIPIVPRLRDTSGEWGIDPVSGVALQLLAGTEVLPVPLIGLPPVGTLTRIDLLFYGAWSSAMHGGEIGTKPSIHGYALDPTTGDVDDLGNVAYAWVSVAAYESPQEISITGLTVDLSTRLVTLVVSGEDGANAEAESFAALAVRATITP